MVRREPGQRVVARGVEHDASALHEEHAIGVARADAPDAARRRAPRSRSAPIDRRRTSSAAPGSSCDVGSSSSSSCGRSASAEARQTRCSSPPDSSPTVRSARCSAADERQRLIDTGPDLVGSTPRFSSPNATSLPTRFITTWSSGSWKTDATVPASCAGCERAGVEPAHDDAAGERAAVEVRDEPGERTEERRLARPRRRRAARSARRGSISQRDPVQHRRAAAVGEAEVVDGR